MQQPNPFDILVEAAISIIDNDAAWIEFENSLNDYRNAECKANENNLQHSSSVCSGRKNNGSRSNNNRRGEIRNETSYHPKHMVLHANP